MPLITTIESSPLAATGACQVAGCAARAAYTPILSISLLGSERVSRVILPAHVCAGHRETFSQRFLTSGRRNDMEAALRSRGRAAPDWARTRVYFVSA
ncbi:MAG TPA: hypothetical protein VFP80_05650 [Thermoanaerobaculia bacterium]|nr:hypothetical protein [Thermoanaerobaculia bacterium]